MVRAMSIAIDRPREAQAVPGWYWWLLVLVAMLLGVMVDWTASAVVVAFFVAQRFRAFDFVVAYLITVAVASIVNYTAGNLTRDLGVLTATVLFALACYFLQMRGRSLAIPDTI